MLREYDQLISWAEMYDHCTFEARKMIVAKFVKAVRVRRDYEIDIEFYATHFCRCQIGYQQHFMFNSIFFTNEQFAGKRAILPLVQTLKQK